jgi:hypothetical protein
MVRSIQCTLDGSHFCKFEQGHGRFGGTFAAFYRLVAASVALG